MDMEALKKEIKRRTRPSPERLLELSRLAPQLSRLIPKYISNIPLALYHELARSRDMPTRAAVAKDHQAPLEILEILARDPQWTVAKAVLGAKVNRKVTLSRTIFETIAGHKRFSVRQTAAESRFCPPDLLEFLARDPAPEVRRAVAENPKASAELLHSLAGDSDNLVVWHVAVHVNASDETLDLLAEHPHPYTRQKSIYPHLSFGHSRTIPVERLIKLSNDPERETLEDIIKHRQAPTWLVEDILGKHPELFEIDPELYIRDGTVYGSLSGDALASAVRHHPDLAETWLERIAQIRDGSSFPFLLAHPNFNLRVLQNLARTNLEFLAELQAKPPKANASAIEQKLFSDFCFKCAYALSRLTVLENLPEHLQNEILEALGTLPADHHMTHQLLKSPFPAVQEFAQGRAPER